MLVNEGWDGSEANDKSDRMGYCYVHYYELIRNNQRSIKISQETWLFLRQDEGIF